MGPYDTAGWKISKKINNVIFTSHEEYTVSFIAQSNGTMYGWNIIDYRHSHPNKMLNDNTDRNTNEMLNRNRTVPTLKYFQGNYYPITSTKSSKENFPVKPKSY